MLKNPELKSTKQNQKMILCPNKECARTFNKPLQATLTSEDRVKTYYACPYCLTEIKIGKSQKVTEKHEKAKIATQTQKQRKKKVDITDKRANCPHYLGYLKERPKNTPIPDTCLSCPEIVQCLL